VNSLLNLLAFEKLIGLLPFLKNLNSFSGDVLYVPGPGLYLPKNSSDFYKFPITNTFLLSSILDFPKITDGEFFI
jgi:hypothetical protein